MVNNDLERIWKEEAGLYLEGLRRYKIMFNMCSRCVPWFWTRSLPSTSQKRCPFSQVCGTVVTDQCLSIDPQLYVFGHSKRLQFHNCCSFIWSIEHSVFNIANLLHRLTTETLDGHVGTRNLDDELIVVSETWYLTLTGYWRYSRTGCWEYLAC